MSLLKQLTRWKIRGQIDQEVIDIDVLEIHHDLLSFIPQDIPEAEQSYYLANIYSLLLEQDKK